MSTNPVGLYILCSILPALSTTAVVARLYVRNLKKQKFGVDDGTALVGLIGLWGVAGVIIHATKQGVFGGHSNLDPITGALIRSWREGPNVKYSWIVPIITVVALTPIKLSVIFLYRRVFHISRFFHYYSIFLSVLLITWAIAFMFADIFQCGSRPWAYWKSLKDFRQYCVDTGGSNVALCFSNLFIDVLILIAPLIMIWKMSLSKWRKMQIVAVFALGFISTAAAAARTYIMWIDAYGRKPGHRDVIENNTMIVMWCLIEVSSALIACCLPVLRPIFVDTWVSQFFSRLQSRIFSDDPSTSPSERQLEEGMAFRSVGGTDFRVVMKHDSMSRKDSKMSTNVDSGEIDLTEEAILNAKDISISKEIAVEQP